MKLLSVRVLLLLGLSFAATAAQAATPATGTLSLTSGPITFKSGPFTSANATPVPLVDTGPTCGNPAPACDSFELTISLPAGYVAGHGADSVRVTTGWTATPAAASDYDLWIYRGQAPTTTRTQTPPYSSASGANPESTEIYPIKDGDEVFTIKVVPYTPAGGETLTTTIELVSRVPGPVIFTPGFGNPDPVAPNVARYVNDAPFGLTAEAGSGECNIGFNEKTANIMFMCFGGGQVYRVTAPQFLPEPLPEACPAVWTDVTPAATSQAQPVADPILFTDRISGRTWASNLTAGPNVSYAYTDNDGASWVNAGAGGVAGADHQTIGSGPYPASFSLPHPLHKNAVYFCSQTIASINGGAGAGCIRSDDGGASYGATTLAYDGSICKGLHGHVRVAPDGTVWLPVASCDTGTGYALSTDAGLTWNDAMLPASADKGDLGSDPSISIDDANRAYFCYADGDGKMKVTVSTDRGANWTDNTDIGASHGIINSAFPQSWAGSDGRAACAFLGTDRQGNLQSLDFPGLWYLFVSHTYDGGKTWKTRIVTPNDPVQGVGGIWQSGGGNPNRNLLDFNEATMMDRGKFVVGYDDGCVRDCAKAPLENPQSFTAMMKLARQTGGKSLYAKFDVAEPHAPSNACLAGKRNQRASTLTWREPDHGGAAIANYKVFRATSAAGPFTFIGDAGPKASYVDTTVEPSVEKYYYNITAVNASGEGIASNRVELPIVEEIIETPCVVPGITVLEDPANDVLSIAGSGTPAQSNSPALDVRRLSIVQPPQTDGSFKITFLLKMQSLATVPSSVIWPISFCSPAFECGDVNAAVAANNKYFTVRMRTATGSTTPVFELLKPNATDLTRATVLLPESTFSTDGTISLVVNGSDLGLTSAGAATEQLRSFLTRITANTPAVNLFVDNMPNSFAGTGSYVPVSNAFCLAPPNLAPLPLLEATPVTGTAPLAVNFSISGSDPDAGDTIASFSIDFGDGQRVTDQPVTSLPVRISHSYTTARNYTVTLTVKDSRGLVSSELAQKAITVTAAGSNPGGTPVITPSPVVASGDSGRFGGSFGLALLPLVLFGLRRRKP